MPPEDRPLWTRETFVSTVRLDTFMAAAHLDRIDMLVVDAQGSDLSVLRSLGSRLADVRQIEVEAFLPGKAQYVGAENSREAVITYLTTHGFMLVAEYPIVQGTQVDLVFRRDA